ncbi:MULTISPECIES: hypothetical protein [Lysobacter]|uniref:hypothetical protein n=1 Tax=Lysobacter TaxID=68 RepID=UPI001F1E59D2|nr:MULTISPECIES: hypothetical protein [Lysobacter]UJB21665.1 hypothetical protein L1A79_11690 [Lysobacter capsici]UJQ29218.1 hypothetical protein L2D09_03175 [Lysobacter gummosus]
MSKQTCRCSRLPWSLALPLRLVHRVTGAGAWIGLATTVQVEATRSDKVIKIVQAVPLERHYANPTNL